MNSSAGAETEVPAVLASRLPTELKDLVMDKLPVGLRARLRRDLYQFPEQETPFAPLAKALIPPIGNKRPFLDLPIEIRRHIFRYLLPEKRFSIEPLLFAQSRKGARQKHLQKINRLRSERVARQEQQQQQIHAWSQFNINNHFMTTGANIPVSHHPQVTLLGPVNPPNAHANFLQMQGVNTVTAPIQQTTAPQFQTVFQFNSPAPHLPPPIPQAVAPPVPPIVATVTSASTGGTYGGNEDKDMEFQRALRTASLDPAAENMVMNLMLTNQKLCLEVAEIMYEEYTFEVHVHAEGVDFLHLPRIPVFQDHEYSRTIESELRAFQRHGQFCFQRMKHIDFVMWGGDPKKRTDGLYMRQTVRKLVDMLLQEDKPVREIKVRFELEGTPAIPGSVEAGHFYDELGTFWQNKIDKRARFSIVNKVTNVELVCTPLESLRGVDLVQLTLPDGARDDRDLVNYKRMFEYALRTKTRIDPARYDKIKLQEQSTMDAAVDYDMKHGEHHLDGYYAPHPLLEERKDFGLRIDDCIEGLLDGSTEFRMRTVGPASGEDVSYEMSLNLSRYIPSAREKQFLAMFRIEDDELEETVTEDVDAPGLQHVFSYNRRAEEEAGHAAIFAAYAEELDDVDTEMQLTSLSSHTTLAEPHSSTTAAELSDTTRLRLQIPNTGFPQRGEPLEPKSRLRVPNKPPQARAENDSEYMDDLL